MMLPTRRARVHVDGSAHVDPNKEKRILINNEKKDEPYVDADNYSRQQIASEPSNDGSLRLIFCALGIYSAYLLYGSLQEDVFTYRSLNIPSSPAFRNIWFIQLLESLTNTVCACIGVLTSKSRVSPGKNLQLLFFSSGISQVCSKALTSLSLAHGLSFPVATMAKSGKMAPVMMGQFFLGGSTYCGREYAQVIAIIIGTSMLGMAKQEVNLDEPSSSIAVVFILSSLVMDGITAGIQKKIKLDATRNGSSVKASEFMMLTNMYMFCAALLTSVVNGDLINGFHYCLEDPTICRLILKFVICSAVGQSFIFYTVVKFDPLICSTITTTRKIISVLLSIFFKGHVLNHQGWCGICISFTGILSELQSKYRRPGPRSNKMKDEELDYNALTEACSDSYIGEV